MPACEQMSFRMETRGTFQKTGLVLDLLAVVGDETLRCFFFVQTGGDEHDVRRLGAHPGTVENGVYAARGRHLLRRRHVPFLAWIFLIPLLLGCLGIAIRN